MAGTRNNYLLSGNALGASEFHVNVGRAAKWGKVPTAPPRSGPGLPTT